MAPFLSRFIPLVAWMSVPLLLTSQSPSVHYNHQENWRGGQEQTRYLSDAQERMQIRPWVLARPNNKTITVLDLAKKLHVLFYQQYPQYAESSDLRYQFFMVSWRGVLDQMINDELMVADATEKELKVSDGEVRREMEVRFGPHVVQTIDKLGLTWDEAFKMVRNDLIVERMRGAMVMSRAIISITPDMIVKAYEDYLASRPSEESVEYQILSLSGKAPDSIEKAAHRAEALCQEHPDWSLEELATGLEDLLPEGVTLRLNQKEERPLASLAPAYQQVLASLEEGEISQPIHQTSRGGNNRAVYRLFQLYAHHKDEPPLFSDLEGKLHHHLIAVAAEGVQNQYIDRLRNHFGITDEYMGEMIPQDFEPFLYR